jgi:alanine dehydrogenase
MGGVPGVAPAEVVVIGGGMAGYNAARVAKGMGAHVTVFDLNVNTLRKIDGEFNGSIETRYSSMLDLEDAVKQADLVIGAVLVPGAKAPRLVTNSTVAHMKSGAVPRTSTYALTNATMPYVLKLADKGWQAACQADPALAKGLSTHDGALLSEQVAADLDLPYADPASVLA